MWLLNVHTHQLESFSGTAIPPYAILSHRWEEDEISFHDILYNSIHEKKAYRKLDNCCRAAIQESDSPFLQQSDDDTTLSTPGVRRKYPALGEELSYVWIDTCCIDKSSSAELSEAINSMYQWYSDAAVCYAYLSDVFESSASASRGEIVASSAWFTRGWTLQELIAPIHLVFFDREWNVLGTKRDFASEITSRTGIPRLVIENENESSTLAAAAVISWAAERDTKREEDRAYSLLGLLGVKMPLLYGEGSQAFHRLQETLLTTKDDTTVLAWDTFTSLKHQPSSIFANSPSNYSTLCRRFKPISRVWGTVVSSKSPWLSGKGLTLSERVVPLSYQVYYIAVAYRGASMGRFSDAYGILVERRRDGLFSRLFASDALGTRCLFTKPSFDFDWQWVTLEITITRDSMQDCRWLQFSPSCFHVTVLPAQTPYVHRRAAESNRPSLDIVPRRRCYGIADIIGIRRSHEKALFFLLGLDVEFLPFCLCITANLESNEALDPAKVAIHSNRDPRRMLSLTNQADMMRLVLSFQKRIGGNHDQSTDRDIEFHSVPRALLFTEKDTRFETSDGVSISLRLGREGIGMTAIDHFITIDLCPGQKEILAHEDTGQCTVVRDGEPVAP